MPGRTIAGYRIESTLGQGGMGVVYRAFQPDLNRHVALKVITPALAGDPEFRRRFERESRLAASIEHPNVIPVYDAGESGGVVFIAMRLVDGRDLRQVIGADGRLDPNRAAAIVQNIGAALDAAHARGLVHRDVKPANVLLEGSDASEVAYLTDFGLIKETAAQTAALTQSGHFVGTVDYIAPEQAQGEPVDARTDVYALGCVLFEVLTGEVPYPRPSTVAKLFAHVNDPPPSVSKRTSSALGPFDAVIERAMAKDPAHRFPSAGDLGRAAEAAASGRELPQAERSVARGEAAPKRRRRAGRTAALVAALVLVAGGGAGAALVMTGGDGSSPPANEGGAVAAAPGADDTLFTRSIGPVRMGMDATQVERLFGQPDRKEKVNLGGNVADPQEDWIWEYQDGDLRLSFATIGGRVESYQTSSPRFETEAGIGVGDSLARLKKVYGTVLAPAPVGTAFAVSENEPGTYPALTFGVSDGRINGIGGGSLQPAGE
jgi:hypothetical protein